VKTKEPTTKGRLESRFAGVSLKAFQRQYRCQDSAAHRTIAETTVPVVSIYRDLLPGWLRMSVIWW
jgi:hypothetical protein